MRKRLALGPCRTDQAGEGGWSDAMSFGEQFFDEVKQEIGVGVKRVGLSEYSRTGVDGFEGKHRIAMIVGDGAIVRGESVTGGWGEVGVGEAVGMW